MIISLVNPTTNRQQIEMESNQEFISCWTQKWLQPNRLSYSSKATITLATKGMSTPIWAALDQTPKRLYVVDPGVEETLPWTLSLSKTKEQTITGIGQPQHPLRNTSVQLLQCFWPQCPQDWTGIGEKSLKTRPTRQNKNHPGWKVWMFHGIHATIF